MTVTVEKPPIEVDWFIPGNESLAPRTVQVGDRMVFNWEQFHNVHIHPSGNCSEQGAIPVGFSTGASYVFTEDDIGTMVFACDVAMHCELGGQIMTVTVLAPTESPTMLPSASPTGLPTGLPTFQPTLSPTSFPTFTPTLSPTESPTTSPTSSPTKNPSTTPTFMPTQSTEMPTLNPTAAEATVGPTSGGSSWNGPATTGLMLVTNVANLLFIVATAMAIVGMH
eukprot:CAMPEP_0119548298 /NCGR_PEP_ID=MMETSP1352-20130426/2246_1 /TAXON_ID=265584 /ORGANISM="Stauroneis constricta, Strain CCMP1120" /LENGTH=223 /DNA_ID=CAMNT_0007593521 /DNA_START=34 /DNA_END=705 /DNA_ORIENTATION=-